MPGIKVLMASSFSTVRLRQPSIQSVKYLLAALPWPRALALAFALPHLPTFSGHRRRGSVDWLPGGHEESCMCQSPTWVLGVIGQPNGRQDIYRPSRPVYSPSLSPSIYLSIVEMHSKMQG